MSALLGIVFFIVGAIIAIWSTERLLEGLIGISLALRLSAFAVGAVLSGLEAENVAVGLAAGSRGTASIALGTVFGGATFLVCVALGLGALLFPLKVTIPKSVLLLFAVTPIVAGLALLTPITPRWAGAILLLAFVAAMIYLVRTSRTHKFLDDDEVEEAMEKQRPLWLAIVYTIGGLILISIGGELVALGAERVIASFGVPALFMGMIVAPAAIEIEEVFRQAVPSKEGRHDVSAGNLIGTLLYFLLFNLGLIALLTPVRVDPLVIRLDWPFLIIVTLLATIFLWHKQVGRLAGTILLSAYIVYIVLHIVLR